MGGNGKLTLTASLTRLYWVAGQQCFVHLNIQNETKKVVTSVTISLLRNTVIFRPLPQLDPLLPGKSRYERDPDACQTSTTTKVIAESVLDAGDRATKGYASAKGWWTGVPPKKKMNFAHSIVIPVFSRHYFLQNMISEVHFSRAKPHFPEADYSKLNMY